MGVFKDLHVYLVEESIDDITKVKEVLRSGEVYWEYYYTDLVDVVVCDREESIKELWDREDGERAPVVTSQWVILSHKCGAILPKEPFYLCKTGLFRELTFCPSKLSRKDQDRLWGMVVMNGGRWQQRLDMRVTHLLTLDSLSSKCQWCKGHTSVKVVSPEWVVDCIEEGRLCPEDGYHPSALSQAESSATDRDTSDVDHSTAGVEQVASDSEHYNVKIVPETPIDTKTAFNIQSTVIHSPLHLQPPPSATPPPAALPPVTPPSVPLGTCATSMAGGTMETEAMGEGRVHPSQQKDSASERTAVDKGGNEPLLHSDQAEVEEPSLQPNPSSPSVTGGPSCAATGKGSDPAQVEGDRPAVPAPSLLEGMVFYIADYNQSMETTIIQKWKQVIHEHGGVVLEEYDHHRCTHLIAKHCKSELFEQALEAEKCIATAYWLNDVLMSGDLSLPHSPLHFPTAFYDRPSHRPETEFCLCWTNYVGNKRQMLKDAIKLIGFPYTGFLCKRTTHIICRKPEGVKYNSAKEWGVHVLNAVFVTDILYEGSIPDVHPYHTDLHLEDDLEVNHPYCLLLLGPWKAWLSERTHAKQVEDFTSRKRQQEHLDDADSTAKKAKIDSSTKAGLVKAGHPPDTPCIMFTGFTVLVAKSFSQAILRLGGRIAENMEDCTHLIAQKISRTVKFLTGVCSSRYILSKDWVVVSVSAGRFVDESAYSMEDLAGEAAHGMKLATSLARASRRKLLKGLCIYSTKSVIPEFATLKTIVQAAGGELLSLEEVKLTYGPVLDRQGTMKDMPKPLIVICRDNDFEEGQSEEEMKMFIRARIPIYTPELVFTGILRQELLFGQCRISPPERFMSQL